MLFVPQTSNLFLNISYGLVFLKMCYIMWLWCHRIITHVIRIYIDIYHIREGEGGQAVVEKKKNNVMSKFPFLPPPWYLGPCTAQFFIFPHLPLLLIFVCKSNVFVTFITCIMWHRWIMHEPTLPLSRADCHRSSSILRHHTECNSPSRLWHIMCDQQSHVMRVVLLKSLQFLCSSIQCEHDHHHVHHSNLF